MKRTSINTWFGAFLIFALMFSLLPASPALAASNDDNILWDGTGHLPGSFVCGVSTLPYRDQVANPSPTQSVTLRARSWKTDLTGITLWYTTNASASVQGDWSSASFAWEQNCGATNEYDSWKVTLPAQSSKVWYKFEYIDGTKHQWMRGSGEGGTGMYDPDGGWTTSSTSLSYEVFNFGGWVNIMKDQNPNFSSFSTGAMRVQYAVNNTGGGQVASYTVTMAAFPANGDTLVAVITTRNTAAGTVTGISQLGASWTRVVEATNTNGTTTEIWYAPNVSTAAKDLLINLSPNVRSSAVVIEYRGLLTPTSSDVSAYNTGNSASASTGTTATTAQANEVWIGGIGLVDSTYTLSSITNSFSEVANVTTTSATTFRNAKLYVMEKFVTSTGTASTGGTVSTASDWSGAVATFKAVSVPTDPFTISSGYHRLLLAGVCFETGANATISSVNVNLDSFTGKAFTEIAQSAGSQRENCWMGYLKDGDIPAGTHRLFLSITIPPAGGNLISGVHVDVGLYKDIDQTTPIYDSAANNSGATSVTFGSQVDYPANSTTVYMVSNGAASGAITGIAHVSGFSEVTGARVWNASDHSTSVATATNTSSGNYALGSTVTWGNLLDVPLTRSAIAVAALNPFVNTAPTVAIPIPDQSATEDTLFSYTFPANTFNDVDAGDVLTYSVSGNPAWLTFDPLTRTFSGTPANADVGYVDVTVTATDAYGPAQISDVFRITVANVNDAPTANDQSFSTNEDTSYNGTLTAADVDLGDTLTFSGPGVTEHGTLVVVSNGDFTYTPALDYHGADGFEFTVDDGHGGSDIGSVTITVNPVNDAPTVAHAIPDEGATEDTAFSYTFPENTFHDVDGDTLTYTALQLDASPLPAWLSFDGPSRTFSGTPTNADVGYVDVTVTADDGHSGTVSDTFRITVANVNDAPTVAHSIPDQEANEDAAFSFTFAADAFADVDVGDALSYAAVLADDSPLPAWLTFDPLTRTFSGTPANADVGYLDIKVTATDLSAAAVSDTFRLTIHNVNDAPTLATPIPDQSGSVGNLFSYAFPADTFNDVDATDTLTYTAVLADDSPLPTWLTFTPASRSFSGTPGAGDVGAIDIKVTADDGHGGTVSDTFQLSVVNTNTPPTVAHPIPDQHAQVGTAFAYAFPANTFEDVDVGDTLTYTAVLADDSPLPAWLTFTSASRSFSGTPGTGDLGAIDIKVTADDGHSGTVSDTFQLTVLPALQVTDLDLLSATAQTGPWTAVPGSFAGGFKLTLDTSVPWYYLDTNTITANRTLADGSYPFYLASHPDGFFEYWNAKGVNASATGYLGMLWQIINSNQPMFYLKVVGTEYTLVDGFSFLMGYGEIPLRLEGSYWPGVYSFTGAVADGYGLPASLTVGITFNDIPVANPQTLTTAEDAPLPITLTAVDHFPGTLNWTVVDQTTLHGALSGTAPALTYTPTANYNGPASFTFKVSDGELESAVVTVSIDVTPANDAPTVAHPIPDQTATEDTLFSFTFAADAFNDIDVGDTLTYTTTVLPGWLSFTPATRTFSGTPTNADVGYVDITVTADDGHGGTVSDIFRITVNNVNDAPTVANLIPDQNATVFTAFNFTFAANTFNDVDATDTLTYSAAGNPAWLSFTPATRTFSGTPPSGSVGFLDISVTASDGHGGTVSDTFRLTIGKANQAALTVTGPASVTYGATGTITYTGGSGAGVMSYTATVSTGCTVNPSSGVISVTNASAACKVTASKAADGDYNAATSAEYTVTLAKATQAVVTVTGPSSATYGTTPTLTATGGSGTGAYTFSAGASTGCSVSGGTTLNITNASGTCNVTATRAADDNYNARSSTSYPITLVKANQATLSIIGPSSLTFGSTAAITTAGGSGTGTLSFSRGASTGCFISGGTTLNVTNVAGTCSLTASKAADNNYNAAASAVFPVTLVAKPVTVTPDSGKTKVYGEADPAFTYTSSDPIAPFTGALGRDPGKNVGTYTITIGTLSAGANYAITLAPVNFTITTRPISVSAVADTKVYDGDTASVGAPILTVGSLASGDTPAFTQTFDTRDVGTGKTLTPAGAVADGNSGLNYAVTFLPVTTGAVTTRPITVSAVTDSKVYDGTMASIGVPTITVGSLVSGDAPAFTQTFDTPDAGTDKTLTPAGAVADGNSGLNYAVTFLPDATGEITPKGITVTADSGFTRLVGEPDPVFTYTSTDPAAHFTGALGREPGEWIGSFAITQGDLSAGGNYAITFVSAIFTITGFAVFLPFLIR